MGRRRPLRMSDAYGIESFHRYISAESDGTFRLLCFQVWGDDESERDKSLRLSLMLRHCELLTAVGENPHCTHLPPGTGYISETA